MQIREWMNQNSAVVTVAALALLILALVLLFSQCRSGGVPQGTGEAYYYDTETGDYFVGDATAVPPITSQAGNPAVRAHLFTCGDCANEGERFVGYYEKYSDSAKQAIEADPESMAAYEAYIQGRLFSRDGSRWVPAESPEGYEIMQSLECSDGSTDDLQYCAPGM